MSANTRQGNRAYPKDDGNLWLAEGEYGKDPSDGHWKARPFGQQIGDLSMHDVIEHDDGTISVSPSILITRYDGDCKIEWHGYLERGVWGEI